MLALQLLIIASVVVIPLYFIFKAKFSKTKKISGKTAIVTGGSNGLGQQICIKLAQHGCNVIIADISSAKETLKKLEVYDIKSKAYMVDVSNYKEILKMKEDLKDEFESVDIVVNNAGLIPYKTLFEQTSDEIETLNKVNLNSTIFMTKCFIERMIEKGTGHIVSISSTQGIYAFPHSLTYCASKFAVTGFMLGLKEFLRREKLHGIDTTCILPNIMTTRKDIIDLLDEKK
ncbi:protein dhs-3-like [Chironomus tepperi]|uniref:protein dhs-3-like n=1 Tax=Chironomus tepperi TaxID=113505 RepID=UPI00391F2B60